MDRTALMSLGVYFSTRPKNTRRSSKPNEVTRFRLNKPEQAFYTSVPGSTEKSQRILDAINKNAKKQKFDAVREFGDYESKFPKHTVDGTMGKNSTDLVKMRELMKDLIKEAEQSGIQYGPFSKMGDEDLEAFWSTLNQMPSPDTRSQFLAMMLADFELGLRKLARDRNKTGAAPYEDKAKVDKIIANLKKRKLL
jgi:hypothetical protein